jgi:hypothetical protein
VSGGAPRQPGLDLRHRRLGPAGSHSKGTAATQAITLASKSLLYLAAAQDLPIYHGRSKHSLWSAGRLLPLVVIFDFV